MQTKEGDAGVPADRETGGIRFTRQELAGSLGDLGTFIPLFLGMVHHCGLQLVPTLVASGLMNIVSGLLFRIPMPVQPMKAIAAVAIAERLTESQILTAGLITGATVLLLGLSGLIDWLNKIVPKSVIRGLQLALGLKLAVQGAGMVVDTHSWLGWDSVGVAALCFVVVIACMRAKRAPSALIVFGIGMVSVFASAPALLAHSTLGTSWHMPDLWSSADWWIGLKRAALPQIPLTTLNSVIAVCALSSDLFPRRAASPRRVAVSVALMNLVSCPFGAMPVCHGAGGLAAQYRFGARTGGSVIMLGSAKIVLALALGAAAVAWFDSFPKSVLGVLLFFGGLELAKVCRDQVPTACKQVGLRGAWRNVAIMLATAASCVALNTAAGFLIGLATAGSIFLLSRQTARAKGNHGT